MAIVPDEKDWTWVLERRCEECGFESAAPVRAELAALIDGTAEDWLSVLRSSDDDELRVRPSEDRWSRLEYACHVRDVFRLASFRIGLMLDEDDPMFANWDQDATAIDDRYGEQDPAEVAPQLLAAGRAVAATLNGLDTPAWDCPGSRSDGARFDVESFARYIAHDARHHLRDVGAA